jgi:hypothetical protein
MHNTGQKREIPMAKKRVTITIDGHIHEVVKAYLAAMGMTFSGFLTAMLGEFEKEIEGQGSIFAKAVSEMTLNEFGDAVGYWMKKASER